MASSNSTFRFAGFFFKRDKSEKVKHSTLKRAKSGIQLERKKQTNNTTLIGDSASNTKSIKNPLRTDYEGNRMR